MSRTTSGRRPAADPNSIEAKYLKSTVGPALIRGLAEIVERRPNDPIEYLATFLYKQVENQRARQQKEDEAKALEIEKEEAEREKERRIQLRQEIKALREREEFERKQREAEEERQREAEELAKRHKEMAAAMAPTLPAVREEDDEVVFVEFGDTELHRQARLPNATLTARLRETPSLLASRDAQGKTVRDIANDAGLQENVDQIDDFCTEIIREGNTKLIVDLILNGYTDIVDQAKTSEDLSEEMSTFVNEEIPQLMAKLEQLKKAIREGDAASLENLLAERKQLALYRDRNGSTSLHEAIEQKQFQIALQLHQRFNQLVNVKNAHERSIVDLFSTIDEDTVNEEQRESYDQLKDILQPAASNSDEQ